MPIDAPIVLREVAADLPMPDAGLLRDAAEGRASPERHDALARRARALHLVEAWSRPARPDQPPERLRVAAWNAERCADVEAAAALLRRADAGLVLLSEMDLGMARSGNRHTMRDLASALDRDYAFAAEFVEVGLGIGRELALFAGQGNTGALHGNGILSCLPLRDPFAVRLDAGGLWFGLDWHHRRLGGRVALGATVDLARGPVLAVSLHLENLSTPAERRGAVERLLAALPAHGPAVVAGDLNAAALPIAVSAPDWLARADREEPLFAAMREAGFDWTASNTPEQTRRVIPDGRPAPAMRRVDWIFTRDLRAAEPRVWPAVDAQGAALSDHEFITVDIG